MSAGPRITAVRGRAIPLTGNDIDTDRIMPARYLKCVTFENLGQYVFQDERFAPDGKPTSHPFNDPRFKGASVLIVNKNFGCGSSREHAPQGILRSGIRAVVGESFAEIFADNCAAIGLPAVVAREADVKNLMSVVQDDPACEVQVDLVAREVSYGDFSMPVELKESYRKRLVEGMWDTAATLLEAKDQVRLTAEKIPYMKWKMREKAR